MRKIWILLLLALVLAVSAASAEEAKDITKKCRITRDGKSYAAAKILDRRYSTYGQISRGSGLVIDGKGKIISGIFLQFYDRADAVEVQVEGADGSWVTVSGGGTYLSEWHPLPEGTTKARVLNTSKSRVLLSELTAYGEGERPANAASWKTLEKADILLLVGHPDDELLWFGGLLPTYAGDRGLDVQVVVAVKSTPVRRLELLDALWACGVTAYPDHLGLADKRGSTLTKQYKYWRKNTVYSRVTSMIRKYKPDVAITQDFNGEYGHGAHRVVADALSKCYAYAADSEKYTDSADLYGTWQVQKVYIHLYKENQIKLDWYTPLASFDGDTAMKVAKRAMKCHASQAKNGWEIEEGGKTDNSLFGLYFTAVGPDEACDDIMEHVGNLVVAEDETESEAEEVSDIQ